VVKRKLKLKLVQYCAIGGRVGGLVGKRDGVLGWREDAIVCSVNNPGLYSIEFSLPGFSANHAAGLNIGCRQSCLGKPSPETT